MEESRPVAEEGEQGGHFVAGRQTCRLMNPFHFLPFIWINIKETNKGLLMSGKGVKCGSFLSELIVR